MAKKLIPMTIAELQEEFSKAQEFQRPVHFADSQPEAKTVFQGRSLRGASFRGADLTGCTFHHANVAEADFRDAILTDADLSLARGLVPAQLSGADLTRCKLPASVAGALARDETALLARSAQRSVGWLVGLCTLLLLLAYSTTDAQLLRDTPVSSLLGLPSRPRLLLGGAPWLVLMLFVVVQVSLRRFWSAAATLPAVFPCGTPVTQRIPWGQIELARLGFPRLQATGGAPFGWPVYFVLAYAVAPLTLYLFAIRVLLHNEVLLAASTLLAFALALGLAIALAQATRQALVRPESKKSAPRGRFALGWVGILVVLLLLLRPLSRGLALTDANLEGATLRHANLDDGQLMGANLRDVNLAGASLVGANLAGARNVEAANLDWVTYSAKTTTWPDGSHQPPLRWKQWSDDGGQTGRYSVKTIPKGSQNPSGDPDLRVLVRGNDTRPVP